MKAGIAIRDLTPEFPVHLGGYPEPEDRAGLEAHDRLWTSLYYFETESGKLLLLTNDLIYLNNADAKETRRRLAEATGLPYERVIFTATHTHSAPQYSLLPIEHDPYLDWLETARGKWVDAAKEAMANTFDAKVGFGLALCGAEKGIGGNRHDKSGPADPRVTVMVIRDLADKIRGIFMNYSLHPTVLHANSYYYSADFVWGIRETLRETYPDAVFGFNQGTSGDQSTRFFRHGQTFDEAFRMGSVLAGGCLEAIANIRGYETEPVIRETHRYLMPEVKPIPTVEQALADKAKAQKIYDELVASGAPYTECRTMECTLIGTDTMLKKAEKAEKIGKEAVYGYGLPVELCAVAIGRAVICGVSAEVFVECSNRVKAASPFDYTFLSTLTNGDGIGYIVDDRGYDEYCYEANETSFARGTCGLVADNLIEMTKELK